MPDSLKNSKNVTRKIEDRDKEIRELIEEFNELEKTNHINVERYKDEKEKSRKLKEDYSTLKKYNERLKKRITELESEKI